MSRRGLDILEREECDRLLEATTFGRVVTKVADVIAAFHEARGSSAAHASDLRDR